MTEDKKVLTKSQEILEYEHLFYAKLYTQNADSLAEIPEAHPFEECPKISELKKQQFESPISARELHAALKQLNPGKCPGLDGLSV